MLHFRATGDDAESAVKALVELVERDFDEATEGEAHVRTA
jgi:phosphocarrier protein HPr